MDPIAPISSHAIENLAMKSGERPTPRAGSRIELIVVAALAGLALSSTFTPRAGPAARAASVAGPTAAAADDPAASRPFRVNIPEADLADLRRRVLRTRWPDKETVADASQGAAGDAAVARSLLGSRHEECEVR